jgi:hypothetical protein
MERMDIQRMADSVLRDYGVPLRVSTISIADAGWTIAFDSAYPGRPGKQVALRCDRASAHHIRESLKRSLSVTDSDY